MLATSLQQSVPETPLPPTPFLNRCLHIFTTRLWPILPIVHLPTLSNAKTNPLLLLSICSLGALADGSDYALQKAEQLYVGVQKAILALWSSKHVVEELALAVAQAATIGQTYALLSGQAGGLETAQAFHGTLCNSFRNFWRQRTEGGPSSMSDWERWCRNDTFARLYNAMYIHNAELFVMFNHYGPIRSHPDEVLVASRDDLYLAQNPSVWESMCNERGVSHVDSLAEQNAPGSAFSFCAALSTLITEIAHARADPMEGFSRDKMSRLQHQLVRQVERSAQLVHEESSKRLAVELLWHSCFLLLYSDINRLELMCGHGKSLDAEYIDQWTNSGDAKRSVAHALRISQLVSDIRIGDVPAMHVPRALWHAGIILAVYSSLPLLGVVPGLIPAPQLYEEFEVAIRIGVCSEKDWLSMSSENTIKDCRGVAFSISSTLRHLGPWRTAARFAETLDRILISLEDE